MRRRRTEFASRGVGAASLERRHAEPSADTRSRIFVQQEWPSRAGFFVIIFKGPTCFVVPRKIPRHHGGHRRHRGGEAKPRERRRAGHGAPREPSSGAFSSASSSGFSPVTKSPRRAVRPGQPRSGSPPSRGRTAAPARRLARPCRRPPPAAGRAAAGAGRAAAGRAAGPGGEGHAPVADRAVLAARPAVRAASTVSCRTRAGALSPCTARRARPRCACARARAQTRRGPSERERATSSRFTPRVFRARSATSRAARALSTSRQSAQAVQPAAHHLVLRPARLVAARLLGRPLRLARPARRARLGVRPLKTGEVYARTRSGRATTHSSRRAVVIGADLRASLHQRHLERADRRLRVARARATAARRRRCCARRRPRCGCSS